MSRVYLEDATLTAIGNAIRDKSGKSDLIYPKDMPSEISAIGKEIKINDARYFFYDNARLDFKDIYLPLLKDATDMSYMFDSCNSLQSLIAPDFTGKNVQNTMRMFEGCTNVKEIDLSSFNTSNLTIVQDMFRNCRQLTDLSLDNFNTSKIKNFGGMFRDCESLVNIDLSNFDTQSATTLYYMFYGCKKLDFNSELLNIIENWDVSNVTDFSYMFQNCVNLKKIDLSHWNRLLQASNTSMFNGCTQLNTLIINNQTIFKMSNIDMLKNTPIADGVGYVYVPDDLIDTYKNETNWSTYASQIKGVSELPQGSD